MAPSYTVYDIGYGKDLTKTDPFYQPTSTTQSLINNSVAPSNMGSGDLFGAVDLTGASTVGGTSSDAIGSAINSDGNVITELINSKLNTSSKEILADFDFGSTDYAGAVKAGDISWNSLTGTITAGSGVVVYRKGIVGASSGVITFSIDATTGDATFSGSITGSTITGGTLQTSGSGKRIRIVSASATSPTQAANSLMLIDSAGNGIMDFGTQSSVVMRILPTGTDMVGLSIQNDSSLVSTLDMLGVSVNNSSSSSIAGSFSNAGSGVSIAGSQSGTGSVMSLSKSGTAARLALFTQSTDEEGLKISKTGTGAGTALNVQNAGTGTTLLINQSASGGGSTAVSINVNTSTGIPLAISHTGTGTGVETAQYTKSGPTGVVLSLIRTTSVDSSAILGMSNSSATSTHFNKMITMGGVGSASIWISDGTTPNGNLSGTAGDICIGADSGKAYYCTGTTNWTAM